MREISISRKAISPAPSGGGCLWKGRKMSYISDYLHGGSEEEYRAEAARQNRIDRAEREEIPFSVGRNYELFEKRENGEWYYSATYDLDDTESLNELISDVWEHGKKDMEVFIDPEEE